MRERDQLENAKDMAEQRLRHFSKMIRGRLHKERRRTDKATARANRAEALLNDYMEMNLHGAGGGGVVEAHMQQLVETGRGLSQTVEEQAEIIDVLRDLLQDHKDFIRRELGASVEDLACATTTPSQVAAPARRANPSKWVQGLSMESSSGFVHPARGGQGSSSSGIQQPCTRWKGRCLVSGFTRV